LAARVAFNGFAALSLALCLAAGTARADEEGGLHAVPSIYWQSGDHRFDLGADFRYRVEFWGAHREWSTFSGLRTRVRAKYAFRDVVTAFGEFQDARIYGLSGKSSGAGALYRSFASGATPVETAGQDLRRAWLEVRPAEGLAIRGGRMDFNLGTQTLAKEANWRYLQSWRAALRLVGTVVWTHGERANDGGSLTYDTDDYQLFLFGANPTTGVFDIHKAYQHQSNLIHAGAQLTARRGTWLPNTEVRPFFLAYRDHRPRREAGPSDATNDPITNPISEMDIDIYTLGFSSIGVYEMGPGLADLFVWGAGQLGEFNGRDHAAGAGIFEAGYMLPDVCAKPWLRAGINIASGGDPTGNHTTFHNLMPTNHPYYGFADALAFQNLMDILVQLKLELHEKVGLNLMYHHFRLLNSDDRRYFGTGAFSKQGDTPGAFGYGSTSSGGKKEIGNELDIVLSWKLHEHVSLQGGYAHLWGGDVFEATFNSANPTGLTDPDVQFGFLQVHFKY
jgi:hypothetical protein